MLAVGPGGLDKEGKIVKPSVKAGDKVLIPQVCEILAPRGWVVLGERGRDGEERERRGRDDGME